MWTDHSLHIADDKFAKKSGANQLLEDDEEDEDDENKGPQAPVKFEKKYSSGTISTMKLYNERMIPFELIVQLMEEVCFGTAYQTFSAAILVFMPGMGEIRRLHDMLVEHNLFGSDQFVLYPLHSTLSSGSQSEVFELPPPGIRKIVIGTSWNHISRGCSSSFSYQYCRDWYYYPGHYLRN